jgi:hypothetical protein
MALDDYDGETVATGTWSYDGMTRSIEIVAFDCDYFFERMPADDGRDDIAVAYPLNEEGRLYYLKPEGDVLPLRPFTTIDEAKRYATSQPWSVRWD